MLLSAAERRLFDAVGRNRTIPNQSNNLCGQTQTQTLYGTTMSPMEFSLMNTLYNLPVCEENAFKTMLAFLIFMSGRVGPINFATPLLLKRIVISMLLSIDSAAYIYSDDSLSQPIRKLLKRFCDMIGLFNNVVENAPEGEFSSTDIFNQNDIQDGFYCVVERNGADVHIKDISATSIPSWIYYFLTNGNHHPTTRETVTKFVRFGNPQIEIQNDFIAISDLLGASSITNAFGVPEAMCNINVPNLLVSLATPPYDEYVPDLNSMILYEFNYHIPEDRQFSRIVEVHQPPPAANPIFVFQALNGNAGMNLAFDAVNALNLLNDHIAAVNAANAAAQNNADNAPIHAAAPAANQPADNAPADANNANINLNQDILNQNIEVIDDDDLEDDDDDLDLDDVGDFPDLVPIQEHHQDPPNQANQVLQPNQVFQQNQANQVLQPNQFFQNMYINQENIIPNQGNINYVPPHNIQYHNLIHLNAINIAMNQMFDEMEVLDD